MEYEQARKEMIQAINDAMSKVKSAACSAYAEATYNEDRWKVVDGYAYVLGSLATALEKMREVE